MKCRANRRIDVVRSTGFIVMVGNKVPTLLTVDVTTEMEQITKKLRLLYDLKTQTHPLKPSPARSLNIKYIVVNPTEFVRILRPILWTHYLFMSAN